MPDLNPVDLFHGLEGGKIADQRPAPPKADAPYPNIGPMPDHPPAPDQAARANISGGLVADRANAQYASTLTPLPRPAPIQRPLQPAPRPVSDDDSSASMVAAKSPPPPAHMAPLGPPQAPLPNTPVTPPHSAPTPKVQVAELSPPPTPAKIPVRGSVDEPVGEGRPAAPLETLAAVPDAPPAPPSLPGVVGFTAPTPPAPTPPPPPPAPKPLVAGAPVLIGFPPGSATLPVDSLAALKLLARQRGDGTISVTGYGEAAGSDANTQSTALPLAMARARAVATNLLSAGVPGSAIRINAEAQGNGAAARLIN